MSEKNGNPFAPIQCVFCRGPQSSISIRYELFKPALCCMYGHIMCTSCVHDFRRMGVTKCPGCNNNFQNGFPKTFDVLDRYSQDLLGLQESQASIERLQRNITNLKGSITKRDEWLEYLQDQRRKVTDDLTRCQEEKSLIQDERNTYRNELGLMTHRVRMTERELQICRQELMKKDEQLLEKDRHFDFCKLVACQQAEEDKATIRQQNKEIDRLKRQLQNLENERRRS